jgi:7-cyano-7-deazaguanine synthase
MQNAVVLLSGGLDSATTLAIARSEGYDCYCLSVDYGQRHRVELDAARRIAAALRAVEHRVITLDLTGFGGSALTDTSIAVPVGGVQPGIPVTYVPARNTIFLSLALAYAEVRSADAIYFGANAVDYSGYPDCRPEYMRAFETLANVATKAAVSGRKLSLQTPIIAASKADIIRRGVALGVDYGETISCYQPTHDARACGVCDACRLRRAGFEAAGVPDPTRYVVRA